MGIYRKSLQYLTIISVQTGGKSKYLYYQHTLPETNLDNVPGGEFHVDDNKTNIKYFIYLKEVTLKKWAIFGRALYPPLEIEKSF